MCLFLDNFSPFLAFPGHIIGKSEERGHER